MSRHLIGMTVKLLSNVTTEDGHVVPSKTICVVEEVEDNDLFTLLVDEHRLFKVTYDNFKILEL